jgi:hypothetical protein
VQERASGCDEARRPGADGEYDQSMRGYPRVALSTAAAVCATAVLAACGSSTKTVTASSAPPVSQTQSTSTASTKATTTTAAPTSTSGTTTSGGGSSTRSAPEPAFAQQESSAQGAAGAAAVVRAHGYTPNDTAEYHPDQTLRVLVGTRSGSGDGYGQQAFFFLDGRYLGTDTKQASAKVRVVSQGDTEVTLAYPLYRPGDPLSTPSGGEARVAFQLNNGKLTPLGKIPPASSSSGVSRQ